MHCVIAYGAFVLSDWIRRLVGDLPFDTHLSVRVFGNKSEHFRVAEALPKHLTLTDVFVVQCAVLVIQPD